MRARRAPGYGLNSFPRGPGGSGRGSNVSSFSSIVSQTMRITLNVRQSPRSRHQVRTYQERSLYSSLAGSTVRWLVRSAASRYSNESSRRSRIPRFTRSNARRYAAGAPQNEKSMSSQSAPSPPEQARDALGKRRVVGGPPSGVGRTVPQGSRPVRHRS